MSKTWPGLLLSLLLLLLLGLAVRPGPVLGLTKDPALHLSGKNYLTTDKIFHGLAGIAIAGIVRNSGNSRSDALIVAGSLGLAKELIDQLTSVKKFDPGDLFFDLLGAGFVVAF